jgi:hypothetical protein
MPHFLLGLFRVIWMLTTGQRALAWKTCVAPTIGNLQAAPQASTIELLRPRVLDCACRDLEGLATSTGRGSPDTVVRWRRQRFRRYWAKLSVSSSGKLGRPSVGKQIRNLIHTIAHANPLWRAPRIHGELLKLGIKISERTVSRILQTVIISALLHRPGGPSYKTTLRGSSRPISSPCPQSGCACCSSSSF